MRNYCPNVVKSHKFLGLPLPKVGRSAKTKFILTPIFIFCYIRAMKNIATSLFFIIGSVFSAVAQLSGSAGIVTNPNVSIPVGQTCATLRVAVTGGYQTNAYTVGQVAYAPPVAFNTGDSVIVHTDDVWSQPLTIPFTFCFFGTARNKILMGSNGEASFNLPNSPAFDNWSISSPLPDTAEPDQRLAIMAPWQDLDPTNQGILKYVSGGVAPNRYFAMTWNNVAMFGDSGSVDASYCAAYHHETQMAVLYETSNNIDIYIAQKDTECSNLSHSTYWNNDLAIEGITDSTMTHYYTVPGRNGTMWTAHNDAWRFSPAGAPDYTTTWFEGGVQVATGDSVQVCPTGPTTYVVQVTYTSCNNAPLTLSDTVHVIFGFGLNNPVIQYPDCIHTGSILAQSAGNTGPVTYSWSNTETGARDTALTAGTYSVTATDSIGQTASATYVLPQDIIGASTNATVAQPTCLHKGSINLQNAPGNNPTDTYAWSNGQTSAIDTALIAATYTLTITDTAGCSATASYTLQQASPPSYNGTGFASPTCSYNANGYVRGNASGGTSPYTYLWSNGEQSANDTALTGATYRVTVTDNAGCTASASYVLQQPSAISFGNMVITPPACYGDTNGSIRGTANGGTGPYTYLWNNGERAAADTVLVTGTYVITITDNAGCSASAGYQLQQPSQLYFGNGVVTPVSCFGDSDGRAQGTAFGGTAPYTYVWSNGQHTAIDTGLAGGNYFVTITDSHGCRVASLSVVTEPATLVIDTVFVQNACPTTGSISFALTGGTSPMSYRWSPTVSGGNNVTVAPGNYSVTVTDAHGCTASDAFTVNPAVHPYITILGDTSFCATITSAYTLLLSNQGNDPSFQWQVNGNNVGISDSIFFPTSLNNNDVITCALTADACATPPSVTSAGFTVHVNQAPYQALCLVSVDSAGTANVVTWEKANKPATDSFFIYRTDTPDTNYLQVAAIPRDSLSQYTDAGANPATGSYRYKMNLKDTCGNYSVLSNYIQTIYLQYTGNGNFVWTPYVVENEASPVSSYNLLRDTSGNNNWYTVSVTTDTTITDADYNLYPNASYEVQAVLSIACVPTRGLSTSTSNILAHLFTGINTVAAGKITLYPNPAHNQFEILNTNAQDKIISLTLADQLGKHINVPYAQTGAGRINADISTLATGMYYVTISYENSTAVLKIVKY